MLDVPEACERAGYAVLMVCRAQAGSRVDSGAAGRAGLGRKSLYPLGELPCRRLPVVSGGPEGAAPTQVGRAVLGRAGVQGVLLQEGLHGGQGDLQ